MMDKDAVIRITPGKAEMTKLILHFLIPRSRGLLQAIKAFLELPYDSISPIIRTSWGRLHVNGMFKVAIQKSGFDIHLIDLQIKTSSEGKEDSDRVPLDYRCKGFIVVHLINLTKTLCNNSHLVTFHRTISSHFNCKDPPTSNYVIGIKMAADGSVECYKVRIEIGRAHV